MKLFLVTNRGKQRWINPMRVLDIVSEEDYTRIYMTSFTNEGSIVADEILNVVRDRFNEAAHG